MDWKGESRACPVAFLFSFHYKMEAYRGKRAMSSSRNGLCFEIHYSFLTFLSMDVSASMTQ